MIHVQDVAPNTGDSNERMMIEEQRMIRWIEEDEDEADTGGVGWHQDERRVEWRCGGEMWVARRL
jgi:hypothetical protein